ncbi:MAG TPA: hypothetical protein VLW49_00285 [Gaiellaceae bacterium]|nr:hypothetical protein [Gaiellaceae bacterium]
MRRLYAWITGAAGGLAAYRLLHRRREPPIPESGPEPDSRADELRAKLAETQAAEESETAAEPQGDDSPEERRRRVHEEARGAIDEMKAD